MAFIITTSKIEDNNFGTSVKVSRVKYANEEETADLMAGKGTHFKLYDGDNIHYVSGKFLGDPDSENAFEPLDWATSAYGCEYIKYRNANGTYSIL